MQVRVVLLVGIDRVPLEALVRAGGDLRIEELEPEVKAAEPPQPESVALRVVKQKEGAPRKAKKASAAPPVDIQSAEASMGEGTARADVYAALAAGPMSSGDLLRKLKQHTPASVYTALGVLRKASLIETRDVEGERKNVRLG